MKQVLLMAVLAAWMMVAGCSKDSDNGMEETKEQSGQFKNFEEPILDFSLTLEELKTRETHKFITEDLWQPVSERTLFAPNPWFVQYTYFYEDSRFTTSYYWTDKTKGSIHAVIMEWHGSQETMQKIHVLLVSRYGAPLSDKEGEVYIKDGIKIIEDGMSIAYYPLDGSTGFSVGGH